MKHYLPLNSNHNRLITEVAEAIKAIYPIGVVINSEDYNKYPGIVKLNNSIGEHMNDYNAYIKPWKSFLTNLPKGFKSKVHNNGFAHQLAYSGELILEKYNDASLMRIKRLVFSVSWVSKFFTIYGADETVIKDEGIGYGYSAINVITISPYREFEDGFNYLKREIEKQFTDYKFLPFPLCSFYIKDLQTHNHSPNEATVYETLFNESLNLYYLPSIYFRGDQGYGREPGNFKVTLGHPTQS